MPIGIVVVVGVQGYSFASILLEEVDIASANGLVGDGVLVEHCDGERHDLSAFPHGTL